MGTYPHDQVFLQNGQSPPLPEQSLSLSMMSLFLTPGLGARKQPGPIQSMWAVRLTQKSWLPGAQVLSERVLG